MLVLSRQLHGCIHIDHGGERLTLSIERLDGGQVRIGFDGPQSFRIVREELEEPRRERVKR